MPEEGGSDQVVGYLIDACHAVLEVEDVEADSDFFDQGGHSILTGRVVTRVRGEQGGPVSLRDAFPARTPRKISEAVSGRSSVPN